MLCKHGCGREVVYEDRCDKSTNKCPSVRKKNSDSLKLAYVEGRKNRNWNSGGGWNKGKTAKTDSRIKASSEKLIERYKRGELKSTWDGKHLPEEMKKNISNGMKRAHAEGRAWNIGKSRWNNEPSYPEKFFMKVIENEFEDKNYKFEHPVGIYSVDFAWIEKKKAIEIDGAQHERFDEVKRRDRRKDKYLLENGWTILRVSWSKMYHDTQKLIRECKDFIYSDVS